MQKNNDHLSTVHDFGTNTDKNKFRYFIYRFTVNPDLAILKKVDEIEVTAPDYVLAIPIVNSLFFKDGIKVLHNANLHKWDEEFEKSYGESFGDFWYCTDVVFWCGGWNETIGEENGEIFIAVYASVAESDYRPHFYKEYDTFIPLIII